MLLDDNFKSNDIFVVDNENIVKMDIYNDKEYYEFLLSATKNKPYYHISAEQLKNYSDSAYYEKNQEYIKLYSYLKKSFNKSDEILNNLLCDIAIFSRKYTDVTGMMNILKTKIVIPKNPKHFKIIDSLLVKITNNTPKWMNRGYSPSYIHTGEKQKDSEFSHLQEDPVTSSKIGRNDFCPCGSGKKYKKC